MTTRIAFLYIFCILRPVTPEVLSSYINIHDDNVTEAIMRKTFANTFCRMLGVCIDEGYQASDPPIASGANVYFDFNYPEILQVKENENIIEISLQIQNGWEDHRIKIIPSFAEFLYTVGLYGINVPPVLAENGVEGIWVPNAVIVAFENITRFELTTEPFSHLIFTRGNYLKGIVTDPNIITEMVTDPNITIVVLIWDFRITVPCDFDLEMFPFDTHYCKFRVSNKDSRELKPFFFPWLSNKTYTPFSKYGFTFKINPEDGIDDKGNSYVGLKFALMRNISPFVFQYHLPSASIVFVSQLSFIIPSSAIPGRVGLLATLFLTLINLFINQMVRVI